MITITSKFYKQQLLDLFYTDLEHTPHFTGENAGELYISLQRRELRLDSLAELFEDILLNQDELLATSPRLYEHVRTKVFSPARKEIERDLFEFISANSAVSVDGYVAFRLNQYPQKIRNTLYAIAKRMIYVEVIK